MTTLLHTCCGPCASACVPRLKELGREVTMFFANSNIDTQEEFNKRLAEAEKLAAVDGVKLVALPYNHEEWLREVASGYEHEPEQGARCARCFRYNLTKAAEYAAAHGFDEFTTSLTVSPHKVSRTIFEVSSSIEQSRNRTIRFLPVDFKKHEGFKLSTQRTKELGLYRQSYCGCEFSKWRIHHRSETASTNLDARLGKIGDVFTADYQTAGRGRLDHVWESPRGTDLLMSVVLEVAGLKPEEVATLPLVVGLAVAQAVHGQIKWPNDIFIEGEKVAGILCERNDDMVIAGIGVNVGQTRYRSVGGEVVAVRNAVLGRLARVYAEWRQRGFAAVYPAIAALDWLKGRDVAVRQTDEDAAPVRGRCTGIEPDGSLGVGGEKLFAGETHVENY